MTRVIAVTSGKGGVGKTMITANIGTVLAMFGKKVCLIDADFGLRNLDIPLGLSNRIYFDSSDYLNGYCKLEQALIRDKQLPSLHLLPGNKNESIMEYDVNLFKQLISNLIEYKDYDFILIDTPAGIESGFEIATSVINEAIIVTTPDRTSIQDADRVLGLLEDIIDTPPYLIINRYNYSFTSAGGLLGIPDILGMLTNNLLGVILDDELIIKSIHDGCPIAYSSHLESGLTLRNIAKNLVNQTCVDYTMMENKNALQKKNSPLHRIIKKIVNV